jgi:aminoglycoside 3-N-acetyltransferase
VLFPAFSFECEDPAGWVAPPLPPEEVPARQAATRGFCPAETPVSADLGYMAEYVRRQEGTLRSNHPSLSFSAFGPRAAEALAGQALQLPMGDRSPLDWLSSQGGAVLTVGTPLTSFTLLHLPETLASRSYVRATWRRMRSAALGWLWVRGAPGHSEGFVHAADEVRRATLGEGPLGQAKATAVDAASLVALALEGLERDPAWLLCDEPGCPFCVPARRWLCGEIAEIRYGDRDPATGPDDQR